MKRKYLLYKAFLPIVLFITASFSFYQNTAYQLVKEMFVSTRQIKQMTYVMKKKERIEGKMLIQQSAVKLHLSPLKVYLRQELPKAGLEVLYVHGYNNNKALVNTNGFPWVNLSLDPMGSTMRENQHHTILESGYSHVISILEYLTTKYDKKVDEMVTLQGTTQYEGIACWIVNFSNPYFRYEDYTVKKNETILSIASKYKLSEHMIMEKNPSIDSYTDVKEGQLIRIPNDYSPRMELYIDKARMIPLSVKVFDNEGLYEHYEYSNVNLSPTFDANEFLKENSKYGF